MMQPFEGVESRHQRSKQKWQQKMQKQKEEEMENLRASRTFKANPIPDTINVRVKCAAYGSLKHARSAPHIYSFALRPISSQFA